MSAKTKEVGTAEEKRVQWKAMSAADKIATAVARTPAVDAKELELLQAITGLFICGVDLQPNVSFSVADDWAYAYPYQACDGSIRLRIHDDVSLGQVFLSVVPETQRFKLEGFELNESFNVANAVSMISVLDTFARMFDNAPLAKPLVDIRKILDAHGMLSTNPTVQPASEPNPLNLAFNTRAKPVVDTAVAAKTGM